MLIRFDWTIFLTVTHVLFVTAVILRVIMRRPTTGVALAWMLVVATLPFVGALLYALIGERRISARRAAWSARVYLWLAIPGRRWSPADPSRSTARTAWP